MVAAVMGASGAEHAGSPDERGSAVWTTSDVRMEAPVWSTSALVRYSVQSPASTRGIRLATNCCRRRATAPDVPPAAAAGGRRLWPGSGGADGHHLREPVSRAGRLGRAGGPVGDCGAAHSRLRSLQGDRWLVRA